MLREDAIDLLDNLIGMVEDNHNADYDTALKMAIKSLEQEPFINKPCVSEKACEHDKQMVLDKIRAEIDEQYDRVYPYNISCAEGLEMALDIIDKYKEESEDKE